MKIFKKALELLFVSCMATIVATVISASMLKNEVSTTQFILASLQQTPQAVKDGQFDLVGSSQGKAHGARHGARELGLHESGDQPTLSAAETDRFIKILTRIKHNYIKELDDQELFDNAIQGVLSNLDPYSGLLDPNAFSKFRAVAEGDFGGLGVDITYEEDKVRVNSVSVGGPANKVGIQANDLISHIEGQSMAGQDLGFAVSLMRGKPGSSVAITIERENQEVPLQLTAVRALIKQQSVQLLETKDPAYAYLRINKFQSATAEDLTSELKGLQQSLDQSLAGAIKGLILDLRNNPGGLLRGAVQVSDLFLKDKTIVSTRGRIPEAFSKHRSNEVDILNGAPIVVLVNDKSASSSEIVAAALQDNSRALVLGETTFGKGIVQTVSHVDKRSALKMTTAQYYTPLGRSIHGVGITPDVMIDAQGHDGNDQLKDKAIELLKQMDSQQAEIPPQRAAG